MVDAVIQRSEVAVPARRRTGLRRTMQRKSTVAFLMALPLMVLIGLFVVYPALYSLHLATLNKSMERFVGLDNFFFLFKRETFWMVVQQSCIFAITAVIFKAIIGFIVAHFVHNVPAKGQRKWRGMLLVPWVIPPAMSTLDTIVLGLVKDEFEGTGFEKDFSKWRDWMRDNMIAADMEHNRASQLERIASAAAQKEQERKAFRERLLGSLER